MRLTAPGGAVERVLIELRQDVVARRRLGLYGLIGVLTLGGVFTLVTFASEWRGRSLLHDVAMLSRHAEAPESAARIAVLGRKLINEQPEFGGSLSYWEARAEIIALAARQPGIDAQTAQGMFDAAEDAARRGLLVSPVSAQTWQRLADIEAARANWANDPAQALAKTVREVAAADPEAALWRADFALTHWADLGAEMRNPVLADLAALAKLGDPWRRRALALVIAAPPAAQDAIRSAAPALAPPLSAPVQPAEPALDTPGSP